MRYFSLFPVAAFVAHFTSVFAWNTTSSPPSTSPTSSSPTGTCATITQTNGPPCIREQLPSGTCIPLSETCFALATVTQSCGCPNDIAVDLQCETTCGTGCFTSYSTVHLPCPTTPSSSSSFSSPTTTSSSSSSSSSSESTGYSNTTVTVTSITTITTCPASTTCTGQTIIWTGTQGPFPCHQPKCTCALPGGTQTVTTCPKSVDCTGQVTQWTSNQGPTSCPESVTCNWALPDVTVTQLVVTSTPTKAGPTPTSSASVLAGGAEKVAAVGGGVFLAAVLGAIGML